MEMLLKLLVPIVMKVVGDLLKPENIQKYGDKLFDLMEVLIQDSETEWDDKTILPIIKMFRVGLNIPDND